jgi:hypothetical protein
MDHHGAVVHYDPSAVGSTLLAAFFLEFSPGHFRYGIRQRVQHPFTGARAHDEVACEGSDFFDIQQKNVIGLLFLQGIDDGTGKFQGFQGSPHLDFRFRV